MLSRPKGNSFESRALCKSNAQNHTFACVLMAVVYSTVSHQSTFHMLAPQRTPSLLENVSLRTTKKEKRGFSEVACKCCKTRKTDDPWSDIEFPGPAWCKAGPNSIDNKSTPLCLTTGHRAERAGTSGWKCNWRGHRFKSRVNKELIFSQQEVFQPVNIQQTVLCIPASCANMSLIYRDFRGLSEWFNYTLDLVKNRWLEKYGCNLWRFDPVLLYPPDHTCLHWRQDLPAFQG